MRETTKENKEATPKYVTASYNSILERLHIYSVQCDNVNKQQNTKISHLQQSWIESKSSS